MNTATLKAADLFAIPMRRSARYPRAMRWMVRDLIGVSRQAEHDHRTHLRSSIEWLCRAQDASLSAGGNGSVADGWTFESGWLPGNSDTTGWLIETFLAAADYLAWPHLAERAGAMLENLLAQPDNPSVGRIHGLVAGHVQLDHRESLTAGVRGGYALLVLDTDISSALQHAQAAHALASLGVSARDDTLINASRSHKNAVVALQTPSGWFVDKAESVSVVTQVSIIRSLIESACLLNDVHSLASARLAAQALRAHLHSEGRLAGAYDEGWMPMTTHVSVPGLAQLAGCCLRLAQIDQDSRWRDAAWRALAWVKRTQRLEEDDLALQDALPSAAPIWAGPAAFTFYAMTNKYFADALMMDMVGVAIPPMTETSFHA